MQKIRSFPFLRLTSLFFHAIISCAHQIKAVILTILTINARFSSVSTSRDIAVDRMHTFPCCLQKTDILTLFENS